MIAGMALEIMALSFFIFSISLKMGKARNPTSAARNTDVNSDDMAANNLRPVGYCESSPSFSGDSTSPVHDI